MNQFYGRRFQEWQEDLLEDMRNTRYALVLSNKEYVKALENQSNNFQDLIVTDIFRNELVEFLGSHNIMEFKIPGKEYSEGASTDRIPEFFADSSQRIIDEVSEKTGWELKKIPPTSDILINRIKKRPSKFDIFISYKSQDVEIVRQVVDILIASGLKVWYAEYQILLQDRNKFEQAIENGINQSSFGIAFTNNRYIKSRYCRLELKKLLKQLGPKNILEVKIPDENLPHHHYPELSQSPGYEAQRRDDMLNFISDNTGFAVVPRNNSMVGPREDNLHEAVCLGRPFTLNMTCWELTKIGRSDEYCSAQGLEFKFQSRYSLFVNLYARPEISHSGQRHNQDINDREMYNYLLKYAPKHLGRLDANIKGVHLLFHENLSQMALTYWLKHYWTRKYSIIIPNPVTKEMAEFLFTFGFIGRFEEFCLYTSVMDKFVKSLVWR